jgi:signal transduction histidine kinase
MLGPLEELLSADAANTPAVRGPIELAHRNGVRLLRLVNSLLDFSRIEAGRMRAVFEATDIGAFSTEIASTFRAAVEKVGCRLVSGHSDYDGLVQAENGQLLRRDAQLDAASDAGLLVDQAQLVERLEHLVD